MHPEVSASASRKPPLPGGDQDMLQGTGLVCSTCDVEMRRGNATFKTMYKTMYETISEKIGTGLKQHMQRRNQQGISIEMMIDDANNL